MHILLSQHSPLRHRPDARQQPPHTHHPTPPTVPKHPPPPNHHHLSIVSYCIVSHRIVLHRIQPQERRQAQLMHQECAGHPDWLFEYDDKCGSQYIWMPYPQTGRESGSNASRWKYRWCLHANLFPGDLLRFSLVPPCLKTGSNFGCSAFFSALSEAEPQTTKTVMRLTDSGPDNDSKTTHGFHWSLIHFGALQHLRWIRLMPKHSHNYADRTFAMYKEQVAPGKGGTASSGCGAPSTFKVKRPNP